MAAFYEGFFKKKNQIKVLYNFRVLENKTDLLFQMLRVGALLHSQKEYLCFLKKYVTNITSLNK